EIPSWTVSITHAGRAFTAQTIRDSADGDRARRCYPAASMRSRWPIRREATTQPAGAMCGAISCHRYVLLFPEGVHGLEARGAGSGGVTGGGRDQGEEDDGAAQGQWVAGLHAVDEGSSGAAGPGGETGADAEAQSQEQSCLAEDQADDAGS